MPDPIEEALAALRQRKAVLDDETHRVREAIASLEQLLPASAKRSPSSHDPDRPSVRTMTVGLMEESDKDWSAAEILTEYRKRGTPVHGKDPSNALRAALADAKKRAMIVSTGVGRYKAAKWGAPQTPEAVHAQFPPREPRMDRMLGRDTDFVPRQEGTAMTT